MSSKTITFLSYKHLSPRGGAIEVRYSFSVLDTALAGTPYGQTEAIPYTIYVKLASSVQAMWGLKQPQMEKVMYEYARRYLCKMVSNGREDFSEILDLYTSTMPLKCPFDPGNISMTLGESQVVA
jgi:hypothetical protein